MTSTRTRKSADQRKAEIVDAAIKLAGEIGPDRLTTEQLAKEVGISQPGIFRHFPTKGDIWWAVAQRIGGVLGSNRGQTGNADAKPAGELRNLVLNHLSFIGTTPAIPAILFSRELHVENEKMRSFFEGLMATRHRGISKLIAKEITAGQFAETLNPDDAAYLILALIQGLAMRWSMSAHNFNLVAEGKRLLDLLLDGFKPKDEK